MCNIIQELHEEFSPLMVTVNREGATECMNANKALDEFDLCEKCQEALRKTYKPKWVYKPA